MTTKVTMEADTDWPGVSGEDPNAMSLDPQAGGSYLTKPIWDVATITANLNRTGYDWLHNNYGVADDGVLNFGFWKNIQELQNSYYVNETGEIAFNEAFYQDDFSAFNAGQIKLARQTIALWNDLIKLDFKETKSGDADITYGNTYTGGAQAYAYLPFGSGDDEYYKENYDFNQAGRLGGDVWIDGFVSSNFSPLTDSYYAKTTMIHETGHALGLSHPGDYNALDDNDGDGVPDPITYANDAAFAQDSRQYSIMSYFDAYETGAQHIDFSLLSFAYAATPLIHDIAAIQAIYGADPTTRTGNTTYGFNSTAGRDEFNFSLNTRPVVAIYDAGGNDTLDLSGWNTPSYIDLHPGAFSSGGGIEQFLTLEQINANRAAAGLAPRTQAAYDFYESLKAEYGITSPLFKDNISIAYGTIIENAIGGGGNDTIIGNDAANRLNGKAGADRLTGGLGADTFVFDIADKQVDIITDYQRGIDKIDVSGIDAIQARAGDQAFSYIGTGVFTGGQGGQLRFYTDGVNGYLAGDTNGDKIADFTIELLNMTRILKTDLIL